MSSVDPARCPLCDRPNECAVAAGAAACWCFDVSVRPGLLERVPEEARGVACVCHACATGRRSPATIVEIIRWLTGRY